jgi:Na+-transporting methylmalonyl-CoA/oxaloacetate decarboxylase gamma subunit
MPATAPAPRSPRSARRRTERGGGPISAWIGFLVFLTLLLFAVQALTNLYTTSVVTAVAFDAARQVAGAGGGLAAVAPAEAQARRSLGRFADRVTFDWSATDDETVVLRVQAANRDVLLPAVAAPVAFDRVDRTVRVRVERFR